MNPGVLVVALCVDVFLSYLIANAAQDRGGSFGTFFVVGFLLSPIISLIMLFTLKPQATHPPAWLLDPTRPGYLRWWDGSRWTDQWHQLNQPTT